MNKKKELDILFKATKITKSFGKFTANKDIFFIYIVYYSIYIVDHVDIVNNR